MEKTDMETTKRDIGVAFESIQSRLRKIETTLVLIREQGHIRQEPAGGEARRRGVRSQRGS
jgi:hypothetical protein